MYEEIKFGINLSFSFYTFVIVCFISSVGLYFMSSKNMDLRQVFYPASIIYNSSCTGD